MTTKNELLKKIRNIAVPMTHEHTLVITKFYGMTVDRMRVEILTHRTDANFEFDKEKFNYRFFPFSDADKKDLLFIDAKDSNFITSLEDGLSLHNLTERTDGDIERTKDNIRKAYKRMFDNLGL